MSASVASTTARRTAGTLQDGTPAGPSEIGWSRHAALPTGWGRWPTCACPRDPVSSVQTLRLETCC